MAELDRVQSCKLLSLLEIRRVWDVQLDHEDLGSAVSPVRQGCQSCKVNSIKLNSLAEKKKKKNQVNLQAHKSIFRCFSAKMYIIQLNANFR